MTSTYSLTSDKNQPVLVDSGFTFCQLPEKRYNDMADYFSAIHGIPIRPVVDCEKRKARSTVNFKFGNAAIRPTTSTLFWRGGGRVLRLGHYKKRWVRPKNTLVLGDTFLRAAYVLFDWDN
ncbi:unnamed protein product [Clonostachys chloroleuca]|uniref:Peptidase A1 domain-containing protein n=1 Tax=Clonostachys chloroleuca TaxID=1926264 RepID=A0AA35Q2A5_9HYPO|nr:unnamed protein product [Clonostachys chloroleuca]CAI6089168.1 unnamed protein product [Clonostachys chloroleuca]CAI6091362.1 unnamed protein product [Clonostachys chloroleuca]CAI6091366.1 unnamed protein product [Clonostachys chloroleuca]